jgi:hypothetical protein
MTDQSTTPPDATLAYGSESPSQVLDLYRPATGDSAVPVTRVPLSRVRPSKRFPSSFGRPTR